jgi:hypothetical protein
MTVIIKQSEATPNLRKLRFFCADDDSADSYAPKTGLTFSAGELKLSKGGATTEVNHAGTVTEIGGGWYDYALTVGEVDQLGILGFRVVKTDVYSEMVTAQVVAFNPYSPTTLGLSNLDVLAEWAPLSSTAVIWVPR